METLITTQSLTIGALVVLLVVALAARYIVQRRQRRVQHQSYGLDHSQAMTDLGDRTRAAAERKERELLDVTSPHVAH